MNRIHLPAIDLNLLVVLDAILKERSVSRAARRLHLTQPAVSHALRRLRALFGDRLFVRTPLGMEPTTLAEQLAPRIAATLDGIADMVSGGEASVFEASSARRFTVGMTDYLAFVLLPRLAREVHSHAPQVALVVRPTDRVSGLGMLDREEVDLVIGGAFPSQPHHINASALFEEPSVCLARAGHSAFARRLSRRRYLEALHLHVSPWGDRGSIDAELARQGVSRRIAVTVGHFLLAPAILEQTDLIATLPARLARPWAERFGLSLSDPPFDLGLTPIAAYWHRRQDQNPGLVWLRNCVAEIARDL